MLSDVKSYNLTWPKTAATWKVVEFMASDEGILTERMVEN